MKCYNITQQEFYTFFFSKVTVDLKRLKFVQIQSTMNVYLKVKVTVDTSAQHRLVSPSLARFHYTRNINRHKDVYIERSKAGCSISNL